MSAWEIWKILNFLLLPESNHHDSSDVQPVVVTYSPVSTQVTRPHQRDVTQIIQFLPTGKKFAGGTSQFQNPCVRQTKYAG
jgi:hypothetical protein